MASFWKVRFFFYKFSLQNLHFLSPLSLFESSQSLFWASFGMVGLEAFELTGIKSYTRFWGLLMFGSYSVINVIVLLNLLIAMMSNSYAMIDEHSDTEWKFARTKLWLSYFEESGTLPPPFNIFPTMKNFQNLCGRKRRKAIRRQNTIVSLRIISMFFILKLDKKNTAPKSRRRACKSLHCSHACVSMEICRSYASSIG